MNVADKLYRLQMAFRLWSTVADYEDEVAGEYAAEMVYEALNEVTELLQDEVIQMLLGDVATRLISVVMGISATTSTVGEQSAYDLMVLVRVFDRYVPMKFPLYVDEKIREMANTYLKERRDMRTARKVYENGSR